MTNLPTAVRRVRWTAAAPGTAARGVLERWLAALDVRRYGLPPAAILVVRRARLALPALEGRSIHDPLAACARAAVRPALGGGGHADAVWFADEAELLACLARDRLAGAGREHWWWPLLLPDGPGGAAAWWQQAPRAVPAALRRLGPATARRWLATLAAHEIEALVAALATAFTLPLDVQHAVRGRDTAPAPPGPVPAPRHAGSTPAVVTSMAGPATAGAAAAAGTAGPTTWRLWRLCEQLARAPWAVNAGDLAPAPAARADAAPPRGATPDAPRASLPPAPPEAPAPPTAVATAARQRATRSAGTSPQAAARRRPVQATLAGAAPTAPPDLPAAPALAPPPWRPRLPAAAADERAAVAPTAPSALPAAIGTAYGGLFFVLNAALALGLYGDFTQPRQRGLPVSPWRLLHATARALLGRRFDDDALAAWLHARDGTPPAAGEPALLRAASTRLQRRIGRALDLPPLRVMRLTLTLPARLLDGGERVDLHFALAALPLPLRLAGLDRDPGWIPAAGCDLRFHFD